MSPKVSQQKSLSSLQNALRLLKLFSIDKPEFGVYEMAEALGIANSTAHRLLSTLAEQDFVTKDHYTNMYRLSVSILAMQPVITSQIELFHQAAPVLQSLTDKTNETSLLSILHENSAYCLNKADCQLPTFTYTTHIGKAHPLYQSAAGHVLLAYQTDDQIQEYIDRYLAVKDHSIQAALLQSLHHVKQHGFTVTVNQLYPGITSIAAPVKNKANQVIAAIEIVGPNQRLEKGQREKMVTLMKKAADKLSKRLV